VGAKVEEAKLEEAELEEAEVEQVKLEQRYGRNIASNIFHSIIRWASLEPSFNPLIQAAILRHKLKISYTDFKQKSKEMGERMKGYVNGKTMRALLLGRQIGATQ
jgi:hypothetical protein